MSSHTVLIMLQEASAIIKVTLRKEAGSLPVENVSILWELRMPGQASIVRNGSGTTTNDGEIFIRINSTVLDSSIKYPLHITPAKTTGSVSDALSTLLDAAASSLTLALFVCKHR